MRVMQKPFKKRYFPWEFIRYCLKKVDSSKLAIWPIQMNSCKLQLKTNRFGLKNLKKNKIFDKKNFWLKFQIFGPQWGMESG